MHPFDDVEPLVVAVAYRRPERLLRNDFRKHVVVVRFGETQALAVETGPIRREDVTAKPPSPGLAPQLRMPRAFTLARVCALPRDARPSIAAQTNMPRMRFMTLLRFFADGPL